VKSVLPIHAVGIVPWHNEILEFDTADLLMHVGPSVHTSRENHYLWTSIVDVWTLAAGARDQTDGYEVIIPWIDDRRIR
jgi:hypothetical protein